MKRPLSPLKSISIKETATERPESGLLIKSRPREEPRTAMTYRPRVSVHDRLRDIAHITHRPMQSLIDEAIDQWLDADRPR